MSARSQAVGTVVAGFPSPAEQYVEPQLDLNDYLVKREAATFFVWVEGDSMKGAGIFPGDLLVVDRSLDPADGDIVVASVNGEFTVKRFRRVRVESGKSRVHVWLEPANPNYPVIDVSDGAELDLFGVVTSSIHRFRKG